MSGELGRGRLLGLLDTGVAAARAAGASDAEVSYEGGGLGVTRFAGSYFTQAASVVERRVRVRAAVGARIGAASTSVIDPDGLAEAARRAVEMARHQPEAPAFGGFARPPGGALREGRYVEATAAAGPAERAEILGRIFARAARDGLTCAGALVTGPTELAVATSAGAALYQRQTEALIEVIALDNTTSGYACFYGPDLAALDDAALADEACAGAVRGRSIGEIEPGRHDVVLAPAAVAEVLEWMASTSFSARTLLDGTSLLAGREGQRVCGEAISVRDDAGYAHPQALPLGFDAEGTAKTPVTFLERGVAGRPISELATAARLANGRGSTGHAPSVADEGAEGPVAMNLVMAPGDASLDELIGRVERGLFVTRFHYVNGYLDTRRATMTGMTRDGTFLIEGGKLGRAVPNLRWTETMLEAFERLGGVGSALACLPSRWSSVGALLCPALLVRGFTFTGRSR